jgi:hypothetical protein
VNFFFVTNKETRPEVNDGETKYMFMSHKQNAGQYVNNVYIGNKFFERVEQFKCLGTTQINQNFMCQAIQSCMNLWGTGCYHSVQILLLPNLLSKNLRLESIDL